MDFAAIKESIGRGGSGSEVMANVVVSSYWRDEPMSLFTLDRLDGVNRKLACEIMDYRRQQDWDNQKFYELALQAKDVLQSIANWKILRD